MKKDKYIKSEEKQKKYILGKKSIKKNLYI